MPKFQFAVDNTFDFPVNIDIISGRVRKNFFFHMEGKRLSVEEYQKFFGPNPENPKLLTADFLADHITGWRGQSLVLDETGNPAEFSREAFAAMSSLVGVEMLIFVAYQKAIVANDGDSGRRKNSGS